MEWSGYEPWLVSLCYVLEQDHKLSGQGPVSRNPPSETFRTCKAIFSSSVSKNGEVYKPEAYCMKGTSVHINNMWIKKLCSCKTYKVWDFVTAFRMLKLLISGPSRLRLALGARKLPRASEKGLWTDSVSPIQQIEFYHSNHMKLNSHNKHLSNVWSTKCSELTSYLLSSEDCVSNARWNKHGTARTNEINLMLVLTNHISHLPGVTEFEIKLN